MSAKYNYVLQIYVIKFNITDNKNTYRQVQIFFDFSRALIKTFREKNLCNKCEMQHILQNL